MRHSISRKQFVGGLGLVTAGASGALALGHTGAGAAMARNESGAPLPHAAGRQVTVSGPDQALQALMDGNQRFATAVQRSRENVVQRRIDLSSSQAPFATILACADSRVAPETLFDADLGELFVCRVAGNVVTSELLGSMEYAVKVLNTPLIMVVGHQGCGAVDAAVGVATRGARYDGYLGGLVDLIVPAAMTAATQAGDLLANAVRQNVVLEVDRLTRRDVEFATRIADRQLRVVGGVYDLANGRVDLVV